MSHPAPRLVFPDTTVLINFGLIDEMALLGRLVEGKAAWCASTRCCSIRPRRVRPVYSPASARKHEARVSLFTCTYETVSSCFARVIAT